MQASSFLVKSRGISEKGKFLVKVVRDKVLRLFRPRARPLIPRRFRRARDSFGGQGLNYEYSYSIANYTVLFLCRVGKMSH